MKFHWRVMIWMLAGVLVGVGLQLFLPAQPHLGATFSSVPGGLSVVTVSGAAKKTLLKPGVVIASIVENRGDDDEKPVKLVKEAQLRERVAASSPGDLLWFRDDSGAEISVPINMDPASLRVKAVSPFAFVADIFLRLLKMLIVPIVFLSIVAGVIGLKNAADLKRIGFKAFTYYTATSLTAILVGQVLVNVLRPGTGARLGLSPLSAAGQAPDASFVEVLKRAVPTNVVDALGDNAAMLQIIFFALLLGLAINRSPGVHGERVAGGVESLLEVVMKLAGWIMQLIPYGVFALLVKVVASTGLGVFGPLLLYMLTVVLALAVHAALTLGVAMRVLGGVSPWKWAKAMSPALITAFSTSSSSMTLPVTMDTVEQRGGVSKRIGSFTLPLGATINMDGTALYECIGVVFLAQYYASVGGAPLTLTNQAVVVVLALTASIGAAGIPSAGLVMMLTILAALGLPLEGAALLLAVDRPLDMLRTTVNVWSDTCAAAIIANNEGEPAQPEGAAPTTGSQE